MSTITTTIDQRTTQQERRIIRQMASGRTHSSMPVEIADGAAAPHVTGEGYYWVSESGLARVHYPSAYARAGGRPRYVGSTLAITVGVQWLGRLRGMLTGAIRAPKGWQYTDRRGLCIARIGIRDMDYHLDADDVAGDTSPREQAAIARRNYTTRRANARATAALARENAAIARAVVRDNPLVMVQDSLRAGNCAVGTIRFAESAGIQADRLYVGARASRLRKVAERTGQTARLEPAIVAAWQRENLVSI